MKLSNFQVVRVDGKTALDKKLHATVDVTSGALWWKRTVNRPIVREYAGLFRFSDTGELTPGFEAEELQRRYSAVTGFEF